MILTVDILFSIGDIVYIRTDPNQYARQIVGYEVTQKDKVYLVALAESVTKHYDCEISATEITEHKREHVD